PGPAEPQPSPDARVCRASSMAIGETPPPDRCPAAAAGPATRTGPATSAAARTVAVTARMTPPLVGDTNNGADGRKATAPLGQTYERRRLESIIAICRSFALKHRRTHCPVTLRRGTRCYARYSGTATRPVVARHLPPYPPARLYAPARLCVRVRLYARAAPTTAPRSRWGVPGPRRHAGAPRRSRAP